MLLKDLTLGLNRIIKLGSLSIFDYENISGTTELPHWEF